MKIKQWVLDQYGEQAKQLSQWFQDRLPLQLNEQQQQQLLHQILSVCEKAHQNGYRRALDQQPKQTPLEDRALGCNDYRDDAIEPFGHY
jgi:flagellar biosynthesis regulator FlbT